MASVTWKTTHSPRLWDCFNQNSFIYEMSLDTIYAIDEVFSFSQVVELDLKDLSWYFVLVEGEQVSNHLYIMKIPQLHLPAKSCNLCHNLVHFI